MIRHILVGTVIIIETAFFGSLYILISPFDSKGNVCNFITRIWARIMFFICGVKVTVTGLENIVKNKSYIVVSNHQSHFDIPVVTSCLPLSVRMIAKKELFRIPVFGWAMYLAGHISLDRGKGKKALKSLQKAIARIKKKRYSIVIYPEGTRSPDGEIHQFKKGAFRLALESQLPVLPVTIIGTRQILPKYSLRINKGEIDVVIGEPVITEKMTRSDIPSLKEELHSEIANTFKHYREKTGM